MIEWLRKLFYIKYECNAATIYGNTDTIMKKKKSFELRTAVESS